MRNAIITAVSSALALPFLTPGALAGSLLPKEECQRTLGQQHLPGRVLNIDTQLGLVHVATDITPLALYFPPESIRELKAGDPIVVHLSYSLGCGGGRVTSGE